MLKGLAIFTARSPGRRPVHVADLFSPLQQLGDQLGWFDLYRDDCRAKSHGKPRAADHVGTLGCLLIGHGFHVNESKLAHRRHSQAVADVCVAI